MRNGKPKVNTTKSGNALLIHLSIHDHFWCYESLGEEKNM
jgi:hypothetical protein